MGNILASREWTQQEDMSSSDEASPKSPLNNENKNPAAATVGTPVAALTNAESKGKIIRRKLSSLMTAGGEYTRVNGECTPVHPASKLVLANLDPRSPTTGIVRTPIVITNVNDVAKKTALNGLNPKRFEN